MNREPYEGERRHKLLTQELRKRLPKLYATEKTPTDEKIAVVKFFSLQRVAMVRS